MLDKNTLVKITNRYDGMASYEIADLGINRLFMAGETKEITAEEVRKLSYSIGGMALLKDFLVIDNAELVEEILGPVEPEYYYTENDVRNLLEKGSLAELQDCLDFAPEGTVELVKKVAVETKLNDIQKRKAILDGAGFDVNTAVMVNEETEDERQDEVKVRRTTTAKPAATTTTSGRRTAAPTTSKYKVVNNK